MMKLVSPVSLQLMAVSGRNGQGGVVRTGQTSWGGNVMEAGVRVALRLFRCVAEALIL